MDVNGQTCIIHKDIYIYIKTALIYQILTLSLGGEGPSRATHDFQKRPNACMRCIELSSVHVCMYVYIHAITINYIHVFCMIV